MKTKYRVKLHNDFTEPYWARDNVEDSSIITHVNVDEYVTYDSKVFRDILDCFLDAPKKKLTSKDIHKDFDENCSRPLPDSKVNAIKTYYNGRLELKKKVDAALAKVDEDKLEAGFPAVFKYCIPFEMNYFSCIDDDSCDKLTKQNDAYIEIEISREG